FDGHRVAVADATRGDFDPHGAGGRLGDLAFDQLQLTRRSRLRRTHGCHGLSSSIACGENYEPVWWATSLGELCGCSLFFFSRRAMRCSTAAPMNPANSGWAAIGLLLNSGWYCTATNHGWSGISITSTRSPSGLVPVKLNPWCVN